MIFCFLPLFFASPVAFGFEVFLEYEEFSKSSPGRLESLGRRVANGVRVGAPTSQVENILKLGNVVPFRAHDLVRSRTWGSDLARSDAILRGVASRFDAALKDAAQPVTVPYSGPADPVPNVGGHALHLAFSDPDMIGLDDRRVIGTLLKTRYAQSCPMSCVCSANKNRESTDDDVVGNVQVRRIIQF